MKLAFFSDVHGVAETLELFYEHVDKLMPDHLVLLGDALYHGPRNGVPAPYNPIRVVELLNERRSEILAVRGNCDAEVDQMLLKFPIMAEFSQILTPTARFYLTHGHIWNFERMPPLPITTIFVQGHTHLPVLERNGEGRILFNPGSISLPKGGNPKTFGFFDGKTITHRLVETGEVWGTPLEV